MQKCTRQHFLLGSKQHLRSPQIADLYHALSADAGIGNGARTAAVVGTKCRGSIAGFALLSYPLEVVLLLLMAMYRSTPYMIEWRSLSYTLTNSG